MGVAIGYAVLGYESLLKGLDKLEVNEAALAADLDAAWEVLAEPIQTVMRRFGLPNPYERLKELTRGKAITAEGVRAFISGLEIPEAEKAHLLAMTPGSYTGKAAELAPARSESADACSRRRPPGRLFFFRLPITNGHKAGTHQAQTDGSALPRMKSDASSQELLLSCPSFLSLEPCHAFIALTSCRRTLELVISLQLGRPGGAHPHYAEFQRGGHLVGQLHRAQQRQQ